MGWRKQLILVLEFNPLCWLLFPDVKHINSEDSGMTVFSFLFFQFVMTHFAGGTSYNLDLEVSLRFARADKTIQETVDVTG